MTYSFDLKIRMVNYYKNSNKTLRYIESMFDISKSSLQRWTNNICLEGHTRDVEYKERALILVFIKRSLDHNPFQTLDMLKLKIFNKFELSLTKSTISNYMKIIGYSKKKIVKRLYNKSLKDHILNRKEMKKKFKKLNKDDLICIDESGITRHLYADRGWCKINKQLVSHISRKDIPKNYSLIMAISNKKVLKYELYKQQAINTDLYYLFLEDLLKNIKNKYILMDNVSFHKSKRILELITKTNNKILFIPPYSPDFNPIEEVFAEMKAFIRRHINPITINKDIYELLKKFSKMKINLEGYYRHAFG
jgi:transposase